MHQGRFDTLVILLHHEYYTVIHVLSHKARRVKNYNHKKKRMDHQALLNIINALFTQKDDLIYTSRFVSMAKPESIKKSHTD